MKWDEVIEDSPELVDAFGLLQSENEIAYLLVVSSYLDAINKLLDEENTINNETSLEVLSYLLDEKIENEQLVLDEKLLNNFDFFESKLLFELKDILNYFLGNLNFEKHIINNFLSRFCGYFLFALNSNWLKDQRYISLLSMLNKNTPFTALGHKILKWNEYYSILRQQIDLPLFSENFSLNQIYIPLRAITSSPIVFKLDSENYKQAVVNIENDVTEWIKKDDLSDTIRLINGGPGSGKSSFLKVLSSKLTNDSTIKVVFIPMHVISFSDSLDESINNYLTIKAGISFSELRSSQEKVILLLDGLDELASQGAIGESVARDFSVELQRTLRLHNENKVKIKAIVSGRDIVIQKEKKYLKVNSYELLPYIVENRNGQQYYDPLSLLNYDQRDEWWKKYHILKNKNTDMIFNQIKSENLREITSQPLLNYLVALLLEVGEIQLNEETTINQIYEHLLKEIYRRGWELHETYGPIQSIEYEEFLMILQEISYTAWKNNGRTTSVKSIVEQCKYMNINHILENFTKNLKVDEKSSLTKLLTAFYFKANESLENMLDQTFEFTHKSFSDYLIALKSYSFISDLLEDYKLSLNTSGRRGKNVLEVSTDFISYFSKGNLKDGNILLFLENKLKLDCDIDDFKKGLITILEFVLEDVDFKMIDNEKSFKEINKRFDNSLSNLVQLLHVFYRIDSVKIGLSKSSTYEKFQNFITNNRVVDNSRISEYYVLGSINRATIFHSKQDYILRGDAEDLIFFNNFCIYYMCQISLNLEVNREDFLLLSHFSKYKNCGFNISDQFKCHFISCVFADCKMSDIKFLGFSDCVLVNVSFENVERMTFDNEVILKNVKVNGNIVDNLNKEELSSYGITLESDKEEIF